MREHLHAGFYYLALQIISVGVENWKFPAVFYTTFFFLEEINGISGGTEQAKSFFVGLVEDGACGGGEDGSGGEIGLEERVGVVGHVRFESEFGLGEERVEVHCRNL